MDDAFDTRAEKRKDFLQIGYYKKKDGLRNENTLTVSNVLSSGEKDDEGVIENEAELWVPTIGIAEIGLSAI